MTHSDFLLDPRLDTTSTLIATWPLCDVRLKNNRDFPWLLLIPRCAGLTELYDLPSGDQIRFIAEISAAARLLQAYTGADKINVATIGNVVSQLHIHVVARFKSDSLWPVSVWQPGAPDVPYLPADYARHAASLREVCERERLSFAALHSC